MQPITILSLLGAALVLSLICLGLYTRRSAANAFSAGYDHGHSDARQQLVERIRMIEGDLEAQRATETNLRAAHRLDRDAIMRDCDERVAAYARRSLTRDDLTTLRIIDKQLAVAAKTYLNLNLTEQAQHLATASLKLAQLIQQLDAALPPADDILAFAATVQPNGKSWLVYGPPRCGKTTNAKAIAQALGLTEIVDDWQPGMPAPTTKALVLTNHDGPTTPFYRRVLSYEQAMSLVASKAKQPEAA
ncbi:MULTISPECIES: AAA family ATPase [unclassified Pseudomonas]|uniref:AAA family ATPase n=1 Tax=unclassified Pseudomonas TaxID=196821 RepID=UPI002448ADB9|nr:MULTISPECIES: AAA family ATPase [unclassified Pseudomonas]MDH0894252.1 ATP-binding protein [Pseudomonas sp. GD03875]MDH1063453.1 ATP-binding protein [Pseudomonas sp. GD03985]